MNSRRKLVAEFTIFGHKTRSALAWRFRDKITSVRTNQWASGRPFLVYMILCQVSSSCNTEINLRDAERRGSFSCPKCKFKKPDYEHLYCYAKNLAGPSSNRYPIKMSKKSFIEFMMQAYCYYCNKALIPRPKQPTQINGKVNKKNLQLDRKDSMQPYTVKNTVSCCFECNITKSAYITDLEMMVLCAARANDRNKMEIYIDKIRRKGKRNVYPKTTFGRLKE